MSSHEWLAVEDGVAVAGEVALAEPDGVSAGFAFERKRKPGWFQVAFVIARFYVCGPVLLAFFAERA